MEGWSVDPLLSDLAIFVTIAGYFITIGTWFMNVTIDS